MPVRPHAAWLLLALFALGPALPSAGNTQNASPTNTPPAPPGPEPVTARQYFNAGTRRLGEGKLDEAEMDLRTALARQVGTVQSPALYNLGHVRFAQGAEELKKSLAAGPASDRGRSAIQRADRAIRQATEALASKDLQKMVAAYLSGRGARKELKAATEAVNRAMELHGSALGRWQRALGDFKSALELDPEQTDARHNAQVVERAIANLVDSIRDMQQTCMGLGEPSRQLAEQLQKLKGLIPADLLPPGAAGDEEDEDSPPFEFEPDQKEGPSRDGKELRLSPEEAGWLLEAFKLDGERRLPMGQGDTSRPKDRNRGDW